MGRCQVCRKKVRSGHNVSHSERKTPRRFKPNIQKKRLLLAGEKVKVGLCTSCLSRLKQRGRLITSTGQELVWPSRSSA